MEDTMSDLIGSNTKSKYTKWNPDYWLIFSIKARKNEANEAIHNAFMEFCKIETNSDFTLGLKRLLESYQVDWKYETLSQDILELQSQIKELRDKIDNKKEDRSEAF